MDWFSRRRRDTQMDEIEETEKAEGSNRYQMWQIATAVVAVILFFTLLRVLGLEPQGESASASCETDHPVNAVMCVDLGIGHHDLPIGPLPKRK